MIITANQKDIVLSVAGEFEKAENLQLNKENMVLKEKNQELEQLNLLLNQQIESSEDEMVEDDEDDFPRMKNDGDGFYSGKCDCGGTVMPMYDENPFWIVFCRKCDRRWENSNSSPLPY